MTSNMHPITKQILGHSLCGEGEHKVEYHLRSVRGRTVMSFDHQEHAALAARERKLDLFKVTTITEKLAL